MKKLFLLTTLLLSTSAFAENVQWFDMESYNRYKLTQDIVFEDGKTFKAGTEFDMFDLIGGGIPVAYIGLHQVECKNVDETSEMSLVDVPQDGQAPVVIGAVLEEGCNLGLYVELSDFFTKSAFELVE